MLGLQGRIPILKKGSALFSSSGTVGSVFGSTWVVSSAWRWGEKNSPMAPGDFLSMSNNTGFSVESNWDQKEKENWVVV